MYITSMCALRPRAIHILYNKYIYFPFGFEFMSAVTVREFRITDWTWIEKGGASTSVCFIFICVPVIASVLTFLRYC